MFGNFRISVQLLRITVSTSLSIGLSLSLSLASKIAHADTLPSQATNFTEAEDIAFGKPARGSTAATPAANAVDGDSQTWWKSAENKRPNRYLEIDLQGYYALNELELALGTTGDKDVPRDFEVQAQNAGCWTQIPGTKVTSNPASGRAHIFSIAKENIITNKIRFVCSEKDHDCAVRTLAVRGTVANPDDAAEPLCTAGKQVVRRSPAYDYAEYLPDTYNDDPSKSFAIVIALHGKTGNTLSEDRSAIAPNAEGLPKQLESNTGIRKMFNSVGAIGISPHCRAENGPRECWFKPAQLEELWQDILSTYRIDPDRVYVTGLSAGGILTNYFAFLHAKELAAIVPIAADPNYIPQVYKKFDAAGAPIPGPDGRHICDMKKLAILAIHGTADEEVPAIGSVNLQNYMNKKCAPLQPKTVLRLVPDGKHKPAIWDRYGYADTKVFDWLFAQRTSGKDEPATHKWPNVKTDGNKTIIEGQDVIIKGEATHPDGVVENYYWLDLNIVKPNLTRPWPVISKSATHTLSDLKAGTHKYRLMAVDTNGFTGFADVTVKVNPQTLANIPSDQDN